jgi:integrase/recombinase XerD
LEQLGDSMAYLANWKKNAKRDKLFFDEINVKFIRDFQQFLVEELKNHNNTDHLSNLKAIRKVISDAIDDELILTEKTLSIKLFSSIF